MPEIATYIKETLCRYNVVVIPNLGAFEWHYTPARLERLDKKIIPPVYYLAFNPDKHQDEQQLLANHIAQQKGISLSAAKEQLIGYRLELEKELLEKKEVTLPQLGTLSINSTGNAILSITDNTDWAITPGTGLPLLDAEPILRDKSYLNKEEKTGNRLRKKRPVLWISVAGLAAAAAISAIWWGPLLFGNSKTAPDQISELSIMPVVVESQERVLELISAQENKPFKEPLAITETNDENTNDENTTDENQAEPIVENNTEPVVEVKEEPEPEPKEVPKPEPTFGNNDYAIVIGVFGDAGNIERNERLLREKGYQVQSKQLYTGYTRIAAVVNCSSQQELNEKWAKIRSEFTPKAWIARQ